MLLSKYTLRREKRMDEFLKIKKALRSFAQERDWDQFHTPKNLTMALSTEVGELIEHFQWLEAEEIPELLADDKKKEQIADEIADVLSYLVRLSDKLGIDVNDAFWRKLDKNKEKYPVDKARGSAKKYTDL